MSTDAGGSLSETTLATRILEELRRRPDQKASEPAEAIGAERREVNRCQQWPRLFGQNFRVVKC